MEKTYEELIKQEAYKNLALLLLNDEMCKKSNWYCIKKYYRQYHSMTIDESIDNPMVLQPSTVERMIRQLKRVNHRLRTKKSEDDYKQIALDAPAVKVTML